MGTLRHIGRGLTFDDIEEYSFVSEEVHRNFFLAFIDYGSTFLYKKYVKNPASETDISVFEKVLALASFNGYIGSIDSTHAALLLCPNWVSINYSDFKLSISSRNYNATVTHSHQIIGTTCGCPRSWNDKTMILFDDVIHRVHEKRHYSTKTFKLFEMDKDKNIAEVTYQGTWFIVDNGYLNWAYTVPPMKNLISYEEIRLSEWLESMRKDVKCTFISLKKEIYYLKKWTQI